MLGYIKSTRHAATDRRIIARLEQHAKLMAQYQAAGMPREEASRKAFDEIRGNNSK